MGQPKRVILCVDDEPNALILRKMVLERAGFSVLTASSLVQAVQVISDNAIDLVLSDQLMPGGTGTDLARQLKTSHPNLPIIIISGVNEMPPEADQADLFMSKVEGPIAMCEKIASVLTRHAG